LKQRSRIVYASPSEQNEIRIFVSAQFLLCDVKYNADKTSADDRTNVLQSREEKFMEMKYLDEKITKTLSQNLDFKIEDI
jgi:hypothetical protein